MMCVTWPLHICSLIFCEYICEHYSLYQNTSNALVLILILKQIHYVLLCYCYFACVLKILFLHTYIMNIHKKLYNKGQLNDLLALMLIFIYCVLRCCSFSWNTLFVHKLVKFVMCSKIYFWNEAGENFRMIFFHNVFCFISFPHELSIFCSLLQDLFFIFNGNLSQ